MSIDLDDLKPYTSLIVCDSPATWSVAKAMNQMTDAVKKVKEHSDPAVNPSSFTRHGLTTRFLHYAVERPPSWLVGDELFDQRHELVVLFRRGRRVILLATDPRLRDRLRRLVNRTDGGELGKLKYTAPGILNSAFVRGAVKTLWLAGIDRRSDVKPDSKALGGRRLQDALDPLGDQRYAHTASVNELPNDEFRNLVGTSPRKGSVWAGATVDGDGLCEDVASLMDIIDTAEGKPVSNPLPLLAAYLDDASALNNVERAYAAAIVPMELLRDELPVDVRKEAEKWAGLAIDVAKPDGLGFEADMRLPDGFGSVHELGRVKFTFTEPYEPQRLEFEVESVQHLKKTEALHDEVIDALKQHPDWLKVWYESSHTLVQRSISENRFRPIPFEYTWASFSGFDVTKEKPTPWNAANIGAQDSLFCWVRKHWCRDLGSPRAATGWLACNDGALEIADFIHYDVLHGVPELTLIHVKATDSGNAARPIAIAGGEFEIVVSQATKNLHFLERARTASEFTDFLGKGVRDAVYQAGVKADRADMLTQFASLESVREEYRRRVVIVQPRATRSNVLDARTARANAQSRRICQQLDVLLLGLQSSCLSFGAQLQVIGENC